MSACEENAQITELWGVCQGLLHLGNGAEGSGNGPGSSFRVQTSRHRKLI